MDKKPLYIILFCLLVMVSGCGEKAEEGSDVKQEPTIVTGKIAPSPPAAMEEKMDKEAVQPGVDETDAGHEEKAVEPVKPIEPEQQEIAEPPLAEASPLPDKEPAEVAPPPLESPTPPPMDKPEGLFEGGLTRLGKPQGMPYDPAGKVDPFKPLFTEAPSSETPSAAVQKRKKRKPMTPLERVDLSQLKLVGIVRSPDKNRALVEEINGKGYIIKEGTYIGTNAGKVVEILRDRIIVEEEIENVLGNISLQKRELKLQKPLGD